MIRILLLLIFLVIATTNVKAEESIRIASGEWAPYQSESLKYKGFASRIVTEAFKLSGINVEYGYFPWKRSYILSQRGEWDGTFLWFDTPERRKHFYISDPVVDVLYVFFHLKSFQFDWNSIDDLEGIIIGSTIGYDYGEPFQKAEKLKKLRISRNLSDVKNFKLLLAGKIQIFPCELKSGYEAILKQFAPDKIKLITYHSIPLKSDPHHLLLSKKVKQNIKMIEIFNAGLKRLKNSGKVEQYISESREGKYKLK